MKRLIDIEQGEMVVLQMAFNHSKECDECGKHMIALVEHTQALFLEKNKQ